MTRVFKNSLILSAFLLLFAPLYVYGASDTTAGFYGETPDKPAFIPLHEKASGSDFFEGNRSLVVASLDPAIATAANENETDTVATGEEDSDYKLRVMGNSDDAQENIKYSGVKDQALIFLFSTSW